MMSEEPMSDKDTEAVADLDGQIGKRTLIITVSDADGSVEVDDTGFAPWELLGLAGQLHQMAEEAMCEDDES